MSILNLHNIVVEPQLNRFIKNFKGNLAGYLPRMRPETPERFESLINRLHQRPFKILCRSKEAGEAFVDIMEGEQKDNHFNHKYFSCTKPVFGFYPTLHLGNVDKELVLYLEKPGTDILIILDTTLEEDKLLLPFTQEHQITLTNRRD